MLTDDELKHAARRSSRGLRDLIIRSKRPALQMAKLEGKISMIEYRAIQRAVAETAVEVALEVLQGKVSDPAKRAGARLAAQAIRNEFQLPGGVKHDVDE